MTIAIVLFLLSAIILSLLLCVYILKRKDLRKIRFKAKLLKIFEIDIEAEDHEKHKKKDSSANLPRA